MKSLTIGLLLAVLLSGCRPARQAAPTALAPSIPAVTSDPAQDDFEVYSTVLTAIYGSQKTWFISQNTSPWGEPWEGAMPALSPETLADYRIRNNTSHPLEAVFAGKGVMFILVDQGRFYEKPTAENGLVCYGGNPCFNQSKFEAAYPGASYIINLTSVGYNRSRTQALVTAHTVDKRASGTIYFLLLSKENGVWTIEAQSQAQWIE